MSGCDYWSCFIHLAIKMKMRRIERQSQKRFIKKISSKCCSFLRNTFRDEVHG